MMQADTLTLEAVARIVREAAALMVQEGFQIQEKGSRENIVTSSDVAVQHFLTEKLSALLPGSGFFCEEEDLSDLGHRDIWIIDPIDGTANYARGIRSCCISVALARDGKLFMGVVYSPWRGELYCAQAGRGAWLNGQEIRVSDRPYEEALFFTALSTYRKEFARTCSDIIYEVYMESNDVRRSGSAAVELCMMAAGKAELYFEIRLMPWDYAASALILQEAGGCIASLDGELPSLREPSLVVAANQKENLQRLLKVVRKHVPVLPY